MIYYYWIAIAAALCWAIASLVSADVTRTLGGLAFNRLRLFFVSIMLISYTFFIDTWFTISAEYLTIIIISGLIGIFVGDTLLFIALQKIGPRRNNILFSLAAPFTVIINIFFLREIVSFVSIFGCFVVFFGVVIAIAYGDKNNEDHRWETVEGSLTIGIFLAICAALCQAIQDRGTQPHQRAPPADRRPTTSARSPLSLQPAARNRRAAARGPGRAAPPDPRRGRHGAPRPRVGVEAGDVVGD